MEGNVQLYAPAVLHTGEIVRGTHWKVLWGWVSPRAGLDAVAKRKIYAPVGNRTPVVQFIA
jgi:hypothetical protein